ncbi:hypothetical protein LAZ67_22000420 [Cordylochernes scorpioides]|uniref:Transposase Tc1-like domain-containing protein n=1 Tax=Cordylochernes scorpioides TaxID=51811 RepID=A0ABY6LP80_9ARAC|nr:hypothetical protein LAZ67_22000420 [Cordylochernes scorpioides]
MSQDSNPILRELMSWKSELKNTSEKKIREQYQYHQDEHWSQRTSKKNSSTSKIPQIARDPQQGITMHINHNLRSLLQLNNNIYLQPALSLLRAFSMSTMIHAASRKVSQPRTRSTKVQTAMPRRKIRVHYEYMSEFESGRAIRLKEAGWSNRLIARHLCRSDAAIRRCWQKWVNNGSIQRQEGSGRPRATTEREDRAIVRTAVAAPESTLSTIQRVTGTQVSKMTINRRLRERNLKARRPLRCLPLTPVHQQVRLQWCRERSTWICADWGRIAFSDESRFLLCPDDRRKRVWRPPGHHRSEEINRIAECRGPFG